MFLLVAFRSPGGEVKLICAFVFRLCKKREKKEKKKKKKKKVFGHDLKGKMFFFSNF